MWTEIATFGFFAFMGILLAAGVYVWLRPRRARRVLDPEALVSNLSERYPWFTRESLVDATTSYCAEILWARKPTKRAAFNKYLMYGIVTAGKEVRQSVRKMWTNGAQELLQSDPDAYLLTLISWGTDHFSPDSLEALAAAYDSLDESTREHLRDSMSHLLTIGSLQWHRLDEAHNKAIETVVRQAAFGSVVDDDNQSTSRPEYDTNDRSPDSGHQSSSKCTERGTGMKNFVTTAKKCIIGFLAISLIGCYFCLGIVMYNVIFFWLPGRPEREVGVGEAILWGIGAFLGVVVLGALLEPIRRLNRHWFRETEDDFFPEQQVGPVERALRESDPNEESPSQ